ncbi:MAG: hypothetical protein GXO43_01555 [Crenarchaeota archaeon]|nr:hypothetical protein [Thermoproteota archaeon]
MRIKPIRYREYAIFAPLKLENGYTKEFYDSILVDTIRPTRSLRSRLLPLLKDMYIDSILLYNKSTIYFLELKKHIPTVEPPERLKKLKQVADAFSRALNE